MNIKSNTYHHGNLRAELLKAAMGILDESGIEAVTIRQVARKAGVGHSAPANHFAGKRALLTQLAIDTFISLGDIIKSELRAAPHGLSEKVQIFTDTLIEFGLSQPNRFRLLWRRDYLDNDNKELNSAMDVIYDELLAALATGNTGNTGNTGKVCNVSIESKAIALWSMLQGYVTMRIDGNLEPKKDEVSGKDRQQAIVDVLLQGILE